MVDNRDHDESRATRVRAAELAVNPVVGDFDADHLKEINRRLFQDMPALGYDDVTPGEYRPPVEGARDWYKARALEGNDVRSFVAYSRMDDDAKRELDDTLSDADPERLSRLNTQDFTRSIAALYTRLDYLHPFPDGNSRTLRVFTQQLAEASGFELDWSPFATSEGGRNVLYVARDLSVNKLALDRVASEETRRHVTFTLDQLENNRDLDALLGDVIRPHRAIAFEQYARDDALAAFPDLAPAYHLLDKGEEYAKHTAPDDVDAQAKIAAGVHAQIQDKLDAGERFELPAREAGRAGASDKDQDI